jgi:glycosyltransferase involved in cell wall biosynthesis
MPTYNGAPLVEDTIKSVLSQSFDNFEFIIVDDCSTDQTTKIIERLIKKDKRIKLFKNVKNLGYSRNIEECRQHATKDIIFLMGQDDILAKDALRETYEAFMISEKIGAVTRPYFWFDDSISVPVRLKGRVNPFENEVLTVRDDVSKIITMFSTLDQLSGLAYRRKYMDIPFHEDIFPCHIYPFASIFKKYSVMFLHNYTIAVRISTSQTRKISSIYEKSPLESWVEMFQRVYKEPQFKEFREKMIDKFVARNYVGLVQIKNYGRYRYVLREIYMLLKYRPLNIISPQFIIFALTTIFVPPTILIKMVDLYKRYIYSWYIKATSNIEFNYKLK